MNDKNNVVDLLEKAKDILLLRNQQPKKPGEDFNIFTVLQLNEVEHCRLLYELLNPKGSHGMGDCFLRSFFELVLQKPYPTENVSVYREYAFLNGRIDLLIAGKGCCYPIEVKIYADDQQAQLARYDEFAATKAQEHQVYYLTLSGYEPSEQSKGCADVVCLSFAEEIRKWLVRCGELAWPHQNQAGRHQTAKNRQANRRLRFSQQKTLKIPPASRHRQSIKQQWQAQPGIIRSGCRQV